MTILYNCKHSGDQYRITKFVDDDPQGSYLTTFENCDCPAGHRPMCRHREMLPKFIQRGAVNTGWFFDYDRGGWVDQRTQEEMEAIFSSPLPSLPNGVQVLSLDDSEELHNAIADAVGEPQFLSDMVQERAVDLSIPAPAHKPTPRKRDGRRL